MVEKMKENEDWLYEIKPKEKLKINYADMWPDFNKSKNFFQKLLSERYELEISSEPQLLIFSCFGFRHMNYNCTRLFYTGENRKSNFDACDYSLSFENLPTSRQYELPHYAVRVFEADKLHELERVLNRKEAREILNKKEFFCCTVVSNPKGTVRNDFFDKLSEIKKVNSGGRFRNNIGSPVEDKNSFCKQHKFVFAFENEKENGYCTEKITDAFLSNAIPIYYGDPGVFRVFNKERFVNYDDFPNTEALVKKIMEIDSNDEMFLDIMTQPIFNDGKIPDFFSKDNLLEFITSAIEYSKKRSSVLKSFKNYKYWLEKKVELGVKSRLQWFLNKIN